MKKPRRNGASSCPRPLVHPSVYGVKEELIRPAQDVLSHVVLVPLAAGVTGSGVPAGLRRPAYELQRIPAGAESLRGIGHAEGRRKLPFHPLTLRETYGLKSWFAGDAPEVPALVTRHRRRGRQERLLLPAAGGATVRKFRVVPKGLVSPRVQGTSPSCGLCLCLSAEPPLAVLGADHSRLVAAEAGQVVDTLA